MGSFWAWRYPQLVSDGCRIDSRFGVRMTLTVGELVDAAMRVRRADMTDLCEIDLQRLVADSALLAEFVLIACRDEADDGAG